MDFAKMFCIVVLALFSSSSAFQIPSVENSDGSYSIGHTSDSEGDTSSSVAALLSFAQGWTPGTRDGQNGNAQQSEGNGQRPVTKTDVDLSPTDEFFKLLEALLKFKVQLISRAYQIISDNTWLFRGIYNAFINNLRTVHKFTLTGIVLLRHILDISTHILETWQIPSLNTKLQWISQGFQYLVNGAQNNQQIQNQQIQNQQNQNTDYYDPTYDNERRFSNNYG